jgi:hypothetical protein
MFFHRLVTVGLGLRSVQRFLFCLKKMEAEDRLEVKLPPAPGVDPSKQVIPCFKLSKHFVVVDVLLMWCMLEKCDEKKF